MNSILTSIKKLLGISSDYTHFDEDIIIQINSAFSALTQLGVGPIEGFAIQDASSTWDEFIDDPRLNMAKTYVQIKVRLAFDPPTSSALIESYNRQLDEITWRLTVAQ